MLNHNYICVNQTYMEEQSPIDTGLNLIFSNLNDGFVQVYQVGVFAAILVLLIVVSIKIKKQTYNQYVESNTSRKDKDFSYLNNDILMQPRSFEHELKGNTKGFSFTMLPWNKYFNNKVYFFLVIAFIYCLLFLEIFD